MSNQIIVVTGGTGNPESKIVTALIQKGTEVCVLVRSTGDITKLSHLEKIVAKVISIDMTNEKEIANSCVGASSVVCAFAGLEKVIIDVQKVLLDGAIAAGVSRFIPSDYSLDFSKFSDGENRNLDLRR